MAVFVLLAGCDVAVFEQRGGVQAQGSTLDGRLENLSPPVIRGRPQVGMELIASPGVWSGAMTRSEMSWMGCAPDGTGCGLLALGDRYVPVTGDVGNVLKVVMAAVGQGGPVLVASDWTAPVLPPAPVLVEAPRIDGVARDGEVLSATPGTWLGVVDGVALEWLRCPAAGECRPVGTRRATYALTFSDVGSQIRVAATATGPGGSTRALSEPTAPVSPVAPNLVRPPRISGAASIGGVLEVDAGAFSGTAPVTTTIEWLRCGAEAGCVAIGNGSERIRLTQDDAGARIGVRVTARNAAGSASAEADLTPVVADESAKDHYGAAVLASGPSAFWRLDEASGTVLRDAAGSGLDGTVVTGVTLGQAGALADSTSALFNGTSGRAVFGDRFDLADNSPFTLEAWIRPTTIDAWHRRIFGKEEKNALGHWEGYRFAMDASLGLYCERWSDGVNTGLVNRPAAQFVAGAWYHVACVYDGATLRLVVDGVQANARSSAQPVANTAAALHVGSFTNGGSASFWAGNLDELAIFERALSVSELAAHRDAAASAPPANSELPALAGERVAGEELQALSGIWTGAAPMSFDYRWLRCNADGEGCVPIPEATEKTYRLAGEDVAARLRVEVTATNAGGTSTALSEPNAAVLAGGSFEHCVEIEDGEVSGDAKVRASGPETVRGTVVLGSAGSVRIPFQLPASGPVHVWLRARTPTGSNRAVRAGFEPQAAELTALPISGVLRWHAVVPGAAAAGEAGRPLPSWPGMLPAGDHALLVAGADPEVELDAVCVTSSGTAPVERFFETPARPVAASVRDFGAVGDGLADDTEALRAAFDSLQPGTALLVPAGRYRFTAPLKLMKGEVSVVGEGPESVLFADLPSDETMPAIQLVGGYESDRTPLLEDAPALARVIKVAEGAPFVPGDTVLVSSDEWGPPAPNLTTLFYRNRANHARVTEVRASSGVAELILDRPLLSPFFVAHAARVERFNGLREVSLQNLRIEGTAAADPTLNADVDLVRALRCERCSFVGLELLHARKAALEIGRSLDCQVAHSYVHDVTDTGGGGHGYGVALSYTQGTVIRDSAFAGLLRHGITISWGSRENFVFRNDFDRSVGDANNFGSVDLHGQDDYANLVEGNRITGGGQEGIIVGGGGTSHGNDGPWNVVRGNHIEGCLYGIPVYKMTWDTLIEGNTVLDSGAYGIRVDSGSDRARLVANRVLGYRTAGIQVRSSNDVRLLGNELAGGRAVEITGSTGYVVQDNALAGGAIVAPGTGSLGPNW